MPARCYCAIPPIGGVPLLWWTLSSVHVAEEHRPALYPAGEKPPVNPGRTVCLHSCGLPVVSLLLGRVLRSSHYFRPSRNHPPSSTSSLRQPDRPGHKRLQATGVRCFWWTAAPSTSAPTPGHEKSRAYCPAVMDVNYGLLIKFMFCHFHAGIGANICIYGHFAPLSGCFPCLPAVFGIVIIPML